MQIIQWRGHFWPPRRTLLPLGAVAELERAKIIERTTRGRLHRLRMGELSTVAVNLVEDVFRISEEPDPGNITVSLADRRIPLSRSAHRPTRRKASAGDRATP